MFEFGSTVNSISEWFCSSSVIKAIMNSPIYTSLLITSLVFVIIMGVCYYKTDFKRSLRVFIYIFFLTTFVLFIHHYVVVHEIRENMSQKDVRSIFARIQGGRDVTDPNYIPVMPYTGGYEADASAYASTPASSYASTPMASSYAPTPMASSYASYAPPERQDNVSLSDDFDLNAFTVPYNYKR